MERQTLKKKLKKELKKIDDEEIAEVLEKSREEIYVASITNPHVDISSKASDAVIDILNARIRNNGSIFIGN